MLLSIVRLATALVCRFAGVRFTEKIAGLRHKMALSQYTSEVAGFKSPCLEAARELTYSDLIGYSFSSNSVSEPSRSDRQALARLKASWKAVDGMIFEFPVAEPQKEIPIIDHFLIDDQANDCGGVRT